jgi:hypothetical protein
MDIELQKAILEFRRVLEKHKLDLMYLGYTDSGNRLMESYDNTFNITVSREGKI